MAYGIEMIPPPIMVLIIDRAAPTTLKPSTSSSPA